MSARRKLLVLSHELFRLSELARRASDQCSTNAIVPLNPNRLADQVETLRVIEDQMLAVANVIADFERDAGVWHEQHPPE